MGTHAILRIEVENRFRMMGTRPFGAFLALVGLTASVEVIRFEGCQPGLLPPGWTVAMTHEGGAPQWQIERDETAPSPSNVFAQTSHDRTAGASHWPYGKARRFETAMLASRLRRCRVRSIRPPVSGGDTRIGTTTPSLAQMRWRTMWCSTR